MTARPSPGVSGRPPRRHPFHRHPFHRHPFHRHPFHRHPFRPLLALLVLSAALLTACSPSDPNASAAADRPATLVLGAIPDQDPQRLARRSAVVAERLSDLLDVDVTYQPVTDYAAAVSLFRTGDLQLVWFGGLTGVQARLQTPGAVPVAQRDVDDDFTSVFIAHASTDLEPFDDVAGLATLAGRRFVFGSQSSTSGYLMPAWFLTQAGVDPQTGFAGQPGLSGSHDKTLDLVASGSYEAGALNAQVWDARRHVGTVDVGRVRELFRSPGYSDYHWLLGPTAVEQFGEDFPERVAAAFQGLDRSDPADAEVLELFGAERFVPTSAAQYREVEQIGRRLGLVTDP